MKCPLQCGHVMCPFSTAGYQIALNRTLIMADLEDGSPGLGQLAPLFQGLSHAEMEMSVGAGV